MCGGPVARSKGAQDIHGAAVVPASRTGTDPWLDWIELKLRALRGLERSHDVGDRPVFTRAGSGATLGSSPSIANVGQTSIFFSERASRDNTEGAQAGNAQSNNRATSLVGAGRAESHACRPARREMIGERCGEAA